MARRAAAARWTLRLLALGLFAAASVEAGIRGRILFNEDHVFDGDGLFRYAPHRQVGATPATRTNNHGFFGPDIASPKPEGAYRVFVLGSSAVAAPELAAALTAALAARMPDRVIEVNTIGIPRYTSYHNALMTERYLRALEPDCYVYYEGINDNVYNTFPELEGKPYDGFYDPWAWDRSVFADMVRYHGVTKRFGVERHFTALRSPAMVRRHVERIAAIAAEDGVRLVLAPMGAAWPPDDEALAAVIAENEGPMSHFWGATRPAVRGLEANNAALAEVARDAPAAYCPAALSFPRTGTYYRDLCHLTEEGMAALAEALAECIAGGA